MDFQTDTEVNCRIHEDKKNNRDNNIKSTEKEANSCATTQRDPSDKRKGNQQFCLSCFIGAKYDSFILKKKANLKYLKSQCSGNYLGPRGIK